MKKKYCRLESFHKMQLHVCNLCEQGITLETFIFLEKFLIIYIEYLRISDAL